MRDRIQRDARRAKEGTAVESEKYLATNRDLALQLGAVSFFPETFRGIWLHEGQWFEENNVRLFVDVEDSRKTQRSFDLNPGVEPQRHGGTEAEKQRELYISLKRKTSPGRRAC